MKTNIPGKCFRIILTRSLRYILAFVAYTRHYVALSSTWEYIGRRNAKLTIGGCFAVHPRTFRTEKMSRHGFLPLFRTNGRENRVPFYMLQEHNRRVRFDMCSRRLATLRRSRTGTERAPEFHRENGRSFSGRFRFANGERHAQKRRGRRASMNFQEIIYPFFHTSRTCCYT